MKTYKEHIVACIDLLGFKVALESDKDDARIINMLQYFKSCERREQTIETSTNGGTHTAAFSPKIIAQSDQLEISFTDIPQPFDLSNAIFAIIQTVSQITITALKHGFLVRGGVMKGKVYSINEFNFDLAFADALKLEATAKLPIVILPEELSNHARSQPHEFMRKTRINGKYYFWIDFLKFTFKFYSPAEIEDLTTHLNLLIEENLLSPELNEIERAKWLWFKDYYEQKKNIYEARKNEMHTIETRKYVSRIF